MRSYKMRSLEISSAVIIYLIQSAYTAGVTQIGNAIVGGSFSMECVTDSVNGAIQITDPLTNLAANCLVPSGTTSTCLPTNPNYSTTQDLTTKTTTVTIAVADRATHEGTWTCTKIGDIPFTEIVSVLTVPTALTEQSSVPDFEVSSSTSETFTVGVACVYPSAQIDWELVTEASASTGGGLTRGTCTNNGPTGGSCTDTAANSFSCDFVVTKALTDGLLEGRYKLKANLYIDGQYTSTGVSLELSTIIIIKERICECNAVLAIAIIGIIVFVVDVILTWIAHFQLLGNITCPLSLVTKSKSSEGKFKWKTERSLLRAVVTTGICVIALILCIIGIAVCKACQLGSPEQSERTGLILAAIGFAINLVVLILLIIMIGLNRCRVLTISSSSNPDHTETNQVNPENENVTDDQKNQHKMEKVDVIKATSEEMKGIDKTEKVDSV